MNLATKEHKERRQGEPEPNRATRLEELLRELQKIKT